jgi:putative phosphoesterase
MIGLISDTHGLMRPEALAALQGVSQIIHAGDVGSPDVLAALKAIAPVTAIRGDVDHGLWVQGLPATRVVEVDGVMFYVLHDLGALDVDPAAAGFSSVISGHSHQPRIERRSGVLYINPGSAGPRRFRLPVTLALLSVNHGEVGAELVPLLT